MDLFTAAKEQYVSLRNRKGWIEGELKKAPAGRIAIQKRGDSYRWYVYKDQKRQYLPKKSKQEAEDLAYKLYLETELDDINQKLFALESFLKLYGARSGRAEALLEENPSIRELISPRLLALPDDLERWANEKYEKSTEHPEHLKFPTVRGELVRSKSEALISYVLVQNHIPYRYECALPLDGETFHPDFTILRPFDRKIILWEHLGLLDDIKYIFRYFMKYNRMYEKETKDVISSVIDRTTSYQKLCDYINSLSWYLDKRTSIPSTWLNCFKGAGAYYTLQNLIRTHGLVIPGCKDMTESLEAVEVVFKDIIGYKPNRRRWDILMSLLMKSVSETGFELRY